MSSVDIISFDKNRVKVSHKVKDTNCRHLTVQIDVNESEVLCLDCNTRLNPIYFLKIHLAELHSVSRRNKRLLATYQAALDEFKKKRTYTCEHCEKKNHVCLSDISKERSVQRKMKLLGDSSGDIEINSQ